MLFYGAPIQLPTAVAAIDADEALLRAVLIVNDFLAMGGVTLLWGLVGERGVTSEADGVIPLNIVVTVDSCIEFIGLPPLACYIGARSVDLHAVNDRALGFDGWVKGGRSHVLRCLLAESSFQSLIVIGGDHGYGLGKILGEVFNDGHDIVTAVTGPPHLDKIQCGFVQRHDGEAAPFIGGVALCIL